VSILLPAVTDRWWECRFASAAQFRAVERESHALGAERHHAEDTVDPGRVSVRRAVESPRRERVPPVFSEADLA
jgi:hypothetical protein